MLHASLALNDSRWSSRMRRFLPYCLGIVTVLIFSWATAADDPTPGNRPLAFAHARILTAAGKPIENGVLVIQSGKIVAVGSKEDVEIPEKAKIIDVAGKTIIPGLVDTHSHVGIYPKPM